MNEETLNLELQFLLWGTDTIQYNFKIIDDITVSVLSSIATF